MCVFFITLSTRFIIIIVHNIHCGPPYSSIHIILTLVVFTFFLWRPNRILPSARHSLCAFFSHALDIYPISHVSELIKFFNSLHSLRRSRNSNSHTWHFHRPLIPSLLIALLPTTMLLPPCCRLPLTVRWLKPDFARDFPADLPPPPLHMPIVFGPVRSRKIVAAKATQKQPRCVFSPWSCIGKISPPPRKPGISIDVIWGKQVPSWES